MDNWLTLDTWGKQVCDRIKQVFFSMENPEPLKQEYLSSLSAEYGFEIVKFPLLCSSEFIAGMLMFDTFINAYKFCRESIECSFLTFKNDWYNACSGKIATELLLGIGSELNEDCIVEIAERVDILGLADLLSMCNNASLKEFANYKCSNLVIDRTTVGAVFGMMNLCYVLHTMGDVLESISISLDTVGGDEFSWNNLRVYGILYHLYHFTCPNLKSITLKKSTDLLQKNHPEYRSIITMLEQRGVAVYLIITQ